VLMGFDSNEVAGACVSDIIKAGVLPVAIEFMDRPCIEATARPSPRRATRCARRC
jgi:glycolate oxidase